MATSLRGEAAAVSTLDRLRDEPHAFTLFAALRLLEQLHPDRPRLGEGRRASQDPVRLGQPPHLIFAPADVAALGRSESGALKLEQYGFGIFGPNGALPLHLTEYALDRAKHRDDPAVADFVNAFQHRFIALFYRAWADADPAVNLDRPEADRFLRYVGALVGLASPTARRSAQVASRVALGRAGLFGQLSRSAESLERALTDYFGLEFQIRPFVGSWLDIPAEGRTRLRAQSAAAKLGSGATVGARSWQCQNRFEIRVGPLDVAAFEALLPGTTAFTELAAIVRLFTNDEWSWQLRLSLIKGAAPAAALGSRSRLGWAGWLRGRADREADVVIRGDWVPARAAS
jgi:type VI secretion system protein ImpH